MRKQERIHIGTSGWHYEHWRGAFYPEDLTKEDFLKYYKNQFHTVEINNTFYQLPEEEIPLGWRKTVPPGFIFSVKGSRYITHMKKPKNPKKPVSTFLRRIEVLENNLGPILFQLPPRWKFNPDRLKSFLEVLPEKFRCAFELRDTNWFEEESLGFLEQHGAAFCIYEFAGTLSPKHVTADFIYTRLHRPEEAAYKGQYDTRVLSGWAGAFAAWARQEKEVFCYFDNDEAGYAAQDALRVQEMIQE
jgi:uncharacterized protein YecE (DUF72 family)